MQVFVDHCVNALLLEPVADKLPDTFEFTTALEKGWETFDNGELLEQAEKNFNILLTSDTNLPEQHNLSKYSLGFVVIRAESNRIEDLLPLVNEIVKSIQKCKKGKLFWVSSEGIKIENIQ